MAEWWYPNLCLLLDSIDDLKPNSSNVFSAAGCVHTVKKKKSFSHLADVLKMKSALGLRWDTTNDFPEMCNGNRKLAHSFWTFLMF